MLSTGICPAPPPPPHPGPSDGELRSRLEQAAGASGNGRKLIELARRYLDRSETAAADDRFVAERERAAADAFLRAAEHLEHLNRPGPRPPDPPDFDKRVERLYFRIQQCGFFAAQAGDPAAASVCKIALDLYQSALREQARNRVQAAGEYMRASDDLTHAVEDLAQAASGERPPKPKPRP
jgi:hypothetical protein